MYIFLNVHTCIRTYLLCIVSTVNLYMHCCLNVVHIAHNNSYTVPRVCGEVWGGVHGQEDELR